MDYKFRACSIPKKDGEFDSVNEDSILLDEKFSRFAISDGAGGYGIESHLWSKYLTDKLPEAPVKDFVSFKNWQDEIWEDYFKRTEEKLKRDFPHSVPKFLKEGSAATLAAVWINKDDNVAEFCAYGDSPVWLYSESDNSLFGSFTDVSIFLENPALVNCKDAPMEQQLFTNSRALKTGDQIILCSDAIGQFILGKYALCFKDRDERFNASVEKVFNDSSRYSSFLSAIELFDSEKGFKETVEKLWENLADENKFSVCTDQLRQRGYLALDDYSLIILKFD